MSEILASIRERRRCTYDGFEGDVIGSYTTREGRAGYVMQQHGTKIVHVYSADRTVTIPREASLPMNVSVPRWWLERLQVCLQGSLPTGHIGDVVFLLREQIGDMLDDQSGAA